MARGWEHVTPEQLAEMRGRALIQTPRQKKPKLPRFDYADVLKEQIALCGLPAPVRDYRPWTDRLFLVDLVWLDLKICAECDGGEWSKVAGEHARGQGMIDDCYKRNRLTLDGWKVFRFCGTQVNDGSALTVIEQALTQQEPKALDKPKALSLESSP